MELSPGGIAKELNASDAIALLNRVEPTSPVEFVRHDQALELLADIQRLDDHLKVSHKRIRTAVAASNTTVTDVLGIGPILAGYLDRLHRRHRPLQQPGPLRRLQRHRAR